MYACVHAHSEKIGDLGSGLFVWGPVTMGNKSGLIYRLKDLAHPYYGSNSFFIHTQQRPPKIN